MKSSVTEYAPAGSWNVFLISAPLALTPYPPHTLPNLPHDVILVQDHPSKSFGLLNSDLKVVNARVIVQVSI